MPKASGVLRMRPMIEATARANLLRIAKAYAKATGSTLSTVSREFYGKAAFLQDFGGGRCSMTLSNYDRLLADFRKKWPPGAAWPATAAMHTGRNRKPASAGNGLFGAFQGMRGKVSPSSTARA